MGFVPEPPWRATDRDAATAKNVVRLRALLELFDVPQSAVAKASGLSPAYVSSVLRERDRAGIHPDRLFKALEPRLDQLLQHRRRTFFVAATVPQEQVDDAVAELRRVA